MITENITKIITFDVEVTKGQDRAKLTWLVNTEEIKMTQNE
jgi:hypothetical protein